MLLVTKRIGFNSGKDTKWKLALCKTELSQWSSDYWFRKLKHSLEIFAQSKFKMSLNGFCVCDGMLEGALQVLNFSLNICDT